MNVSDAVLVAIIATVPPTLAGVASVILALNTAEKVEAVAAKVEVVHKATNSLTDRLVQVTRSDALQEGHADGVKDQKAKEAK